MGLLDWRVDCGGSAGRYHLDVWAEGRLALVTVASMTAPIGRRLARSPTGKVPPYHGAYPNQAWVNPR